MSSVSGKALQQSSFDRMLFEHSPIGLAVTRTDGEFIDVNSAFARIVDLPVDRIIGLRMEDFTPPESREFDAQQQAAVDRTGRYGPYERELIRGDGIGVPVRVSGRRVEQDGEIYVFTSVEDITERKITDNALKASENRYRELFDNAPEAIIVLDMDTGRLVDANDKALELFRYPRKDLVGLVPEALAGAADDDEGDCEESGRSLSEILDNIPAGEILWSTWTLRDSDGKSFPCELQCARLPTQSRHLVRVSITDITERKRADKKLKEYTNSLQVLSKRLIEAQESERRHIARELHDEIGQSLTALKLNVHNIRSKTEREVEAIAGDCTDILDNLLNQVRNLSLDLRPTMLDDLGLEAALSWYVQKQADRGGLELSFQSEPQLGRFDSEIETACFRVAQEAINNVLRHANATKARVRLEIEQDELVLTVRDNGDGFDLPGKYTRATGGESFGLVGMQERALLAGGQLGIVSESGSGTEIRARFPMVLP